MRTTVVLTAALLACSVAALAQQKPTYPLAEKRPVVQTYGDQTFTDNYQWLENADAADVKAWVAAENQLTRSILDAVPARAEIAGRLTAIAKAPRTSYSGLEERGGKLFAYKSAPPREQAFLVVFDSPSDAKSEHVIYDPNVADPKGSTGIDFYAPSRDGKRVAISLSQHGSEDGSVHVFDVASGQELGDVIPRVNFGTAGGSVAWNTDGSGFWYTRYPHDGERPAEDLNFYQQIWFHKVGSDPAADAYALGKEFPRIAEIEMAASDDGKLVLASVKNGDGGEVGHWLRQPDGQWVQVTQFADKIHGAAFGPDESLFLLSHDGAPNGKLLRLAAGHSKLADAKVIVAEGTTSIDAFAPGRKIVYVAMMAGGPSELRTFTPEGRRLGAIPIPAVSSASGLLRLGDDDLLFRDATYTKPAEWLRYESATKKVVPTALKMTSPVDLSDAVVVRETATSKDGTRVPVNIIYAKGTKLDGTNPTILSGYGGYSISQRPGMSINNRLWLDAGGIIAIANLRGGAEYGEAWHDAGKMLKKQNVFDDFAAVAQHLIARKYTSPQKLAIQGGSNGGLLMGVELTQHPELFRAVVSHVGIYDLPRWLATPNGVFNTTEFGSPANPEQLASIMAYSPYHHVADGAPYPATLFLTGDHDFRVDPMNSRKFVARLQAATGSSEPILLRTTSGSGHGIGTALSEAVASQTDVYSFLWMELGVKPLK